MKKITEWHKALVPCGGSPTGEHHVRICRAGDKIVHISCDCSNDRAAGISIAALGGESCVLVVDTILMHLRTIPAGVGSVGTERTDPATGEKVRRINRFTDDVKGIPLGLLNSVALTIDAADLLRAKRERPQAADDRPLYGRLLSERVAKLAPGLPWVVKAGPQLAFKTRIARYGLPDDFVVASRDSAGKWRDGHNTAKIADQVGVSRGTCHVCLRHAGRKFDNERQHSRGKEHVANVARVVREVVAELNRARWGTP